MEELQGLAIKAIRYYLRNDMTNGGEWKIVVSGLRDGTWTLVLASDNHDSIYFVVVFPVDSDSIIVKEYHRLWENNIVSRAQLG